MAGYSRGFLSDLEASFDASVDREEQVAAADLARALRNDQRLHDVLARGRGCSVRLEEGATVPLIEIGSDYAIGGREDEVLVRSERAVFVIESTGSRPAVTDGTWLQTAREWADRRVKVQVRALGDVYEGTLTVAARDFVIIEGDRGKTIVPHGSIRYLRSCPEG
jgi:hypothetical protein